MRAAQADRRFEHALEIGRAHDATQRPRRIAAGDGGAEACTGLGRSRVRRDVLDRVTASRAAWDALEGRGGREGRRAARSDGQALAALGAARVDHALAAAGLHADEKAVGAGAANFGRLIGALHFENLRETLD